MFLKIWKDFINRKKFSYFILIILLIAGIISVNTIPKESSPEIQIPIAIISTSLTGSTSTEIENQITNEIEDAIKNIDGIDEINSDSSDGISTVRVTFNQGENIDKKVSEIRDEVEKVKSQLPDDSSDPNVIDINFSDQPIFSFSISSKINKFEFKKVSEELKSVLESISGVSTVRYEGFPEYEISIFLSSEKVQLHNLSVSDISNSIKSSDIFSPLGKINIENQEYNLSLNTKINSINDLENIIVKKDGSSIILLKDISDIKENFSKETVQSEIFFPNSSEPTRSISFSVSKTLGYNILKLSEKLNKKISELKKEGSLLYGIEYNNILDLGDESRKDISDLTNNGLAAILLVFLILIFILGTKDAFIAAIGIPISFLLAFIFFNLVGNTLNFISLFSMILSIGVLVDSDIVITEGLAKRKDRLKKENPDWTRKMLEKKAAEKTITDLAGPMVAGTATTIAVFAPLFFLSGVTGQFISTIPFTIIFILIASQIVSIFFIPLLHSSNFSYFRFIKRFLPKRKIKVKKIDFTLWEKKYSIFLEWFLINKKRRVWFCWSVVCVFITTVIFPISGILKSEFFPDGETPYFYGNIELGEDSNLNDVKKYSQKVLLELKNEKFYDSILFTYGKTSPYSGAESKNGENLGNLFINIKEEFSEKGTELLEKIRNKMTEKSLDKINLSAPRGGPATGFPIEFNIVSKSFETSKKGAILAEDILKKIDGVININSELDKNNTGLELIIDRNKVSLFNLSIHNISREILSSTTGVDVLTIKKDFENINVVLKNKKNDEKENLNHINVEDILSIKIKNNYGQYIPISSFAKVLPKSENSTIKHFNQKVSIKITAERKEGFVLARIISQIKDDFLEKNETSSTLEFGGAFAEQEQSFGETGFAFLGGVALIFGILIFLFNSIRLPLIIESVIPLAFSGVVVGLVVTGNPLSFPSILGFIALSGIVVNNSIILIYIYEELRKNKLKNKEENEVFKESEINEIILNGSKERLRPILLTTITTIIGVVPLIFSSPIWAPIAYSIIFGLLFATFITLIFIPIIYKRCYPKR